MGKKPCSPATFEEGFARSAEILHVVVLDATKVFPLFVTMGHSDLDKDEGCRGWLAGGYMDSDRLLGISSA